MNNKDNFDLPSLNEARKRIGDIRKMRVIFAFGKIRIIKKI